MRCHNLCEYDDPKDSKFQVVFIRTTPATRDKG